MTPRALANLLAYGASPPEYPGLVLVPKEVLDEVRAWVGAARAHNVWASLIVEKAEAWEDGFQRGWEARVAASPPGPASLDGVTARDGGPVTPEDVAHVRAMQAERRVKDDPHWPQWEDRRNRPVTTFAWLVERGSGIDLTLEYWTGRDEGEVWTSDPYRAKRFPDRPAAEAAIRLRKTRWGLVTMDWGTAVEHGFG